MATSLEYIEKLMDEVDGPAIKEALYNSIDECNNEVGDVTSEINKVLVPIRNDYNTVNQKANQVNAAISAINGNYATLQAAKARFDKMGTMNFGAQYPNLATAKVYTPNHMNPPEWFKPR